MNSGLINGSGARQRRRSRGRTCLILRVLRRSHRCGFKTFNQRACGIRRNAFADTHCHDIERGDRLGNRCLVKFTDCVKAELLQCMLQRVGKFTHVLQTDRSSNACEGMRRAQKTITDYAVVPENLKLGTHHLQVCCRFTDENAK